jgi:ribosomal protein L28
MILFPIVFFLYKHPQNLFQNYFQLITGKKTVVGYAISLSNEGLKLPKIKSGILTPLNAKRRSIPNDKPERFHKMNLIYARDYSVWKDLQVLLQNVLLLDR